MSKDHSYEDNSWAIGITNNSLATVVQESAPMSEVALVENGIDVDSLDLIVAKFEDVPKLQKRFNVPVILIGTEAEKAILQGNNVITKVVPNSGYSNCVSPIKNTVDLLCRQSRFTKYARFIFPEISVDWEDIITKLAERGSSADSFFRAYHQLCEHHVSQVSEHAKNTGNKDTLKKLFKLYSIAGEEKQLDELITTTKQIGLMSGAMETVISRENEAFAPTLIESIIRVAPSLLSTPYRITVNRSTNYILQIPGEPPYILKVWQNELTQEFKEGLNQDLLAFRREGSLMKVLNKNKDMLGPNRIPIPSLIMMPTKSLENRILSQGYYCIAMTKMPGRDAIDVLYELEKQEREMKKETDATISEYQSVKEAGDTVPPGKADKTLFHKYCALKNKLSKLKSNIVEQCALMTAYAYLVSKLDEGQELVEQTKLNTANDYLTYFQRNFFGDETVFVKNRPAAGIMKIDKQADTLQKQTHLRSYIENMKNDLQPVVEIMTESPSGIDIDRSIINLLVESDASEKDPWHIHHLDFEIFRNDSIMHAAAKTLLLIRKYANETTPIAEDIMYERDKNLKLLQKGSPRGYQVDFANFVNTFTKSFDEMKEAFLRKKPNARPRLPLPSPEAMWDQFHAFSAYRGLLYVGYFSKLMAAEPQPERKSILAYYQSRALENARYSFEVLAQKFAGTPKQEKMQNILKTLQQIHDMYF